MRELMNSVRSGSAMDLLSESWIEWVVERSAHACEALEDGVIELQLTGAPRGRGRVTFVISGGKLVSCETVKATDPDVSCKLSWAELQDMLAGTWDPSVAFMRGDLKTVGKTGPLLAVLRAWDRPAVQQVREELASLTTVDGSGSP